RCGGGRRARIVSSQARLTSRASALYPMRARLFLLAGLVVSCSFGDPAGEMDRASAVASPIVGGVHSDASQDAIVLVMHYDAVRRGGGAASGCTGSLLTPRLVLTARHCVAITDPGAACTSEGKPVAGG